MTALTFPYGAWRGDDRRHYTAALAEEVMRSLRTGEADVAILEHVKIESALCERLKEASGFLLRDRFAPVRTHYRRELPGADDPHAGLSSKQRYQFRRIAKRLATDFPGQVRLEVLGSSDTLERLVQDVDQLAKKTWQNKLGLGGFEPSQALRAKLTTLAASGALRGYVLYIRDAPAAFWLGAVYQQVFYSDYMGYDPAYASYRLGTHLLSELLESLCRDGVRAIDFGFSEDEYKKRLGNTEWRETTLFVCAPTFRALRFSLMRSAVAVVANVIRTLVKSTGLMQRIKTVWRRTASRDASSGQAVPEADV
jgi:CelD/BcsL family acetyltransferase involved in cellulose biosynthesis